MATALLIVAIGALVLALMCLGSAFFLGAGSAFLAPSGAFRGETPANVDGIKTAVLAYEAAFDEVVATQPAPRPMSELDTSAVAWTHPDDFNKLGWAPDGLVRGVYWVSVSGDGNFEVHGMIDADGDGVPAHYRATRDGRTLQLTPDDVR